MAVTILHLVNADEPVSETVRAWIARDYNKANVKNIQPIIMSRFGFDKDQSSLDKPPLNDAAWQNVLHKNAVRIYENGEAREQKSGGPGFVRKKTTIVIDVFGTTTHNRDLIAHEIDRIMLETLINTSARLKKSDNTDDSKISKFDREALDWTDTNELLKNNVYQLSAELGAVWAYSKT